MALPTKHLPFLFLLILSISLQIQARESKFFSKVTPYNSSNKKRNVKEPIYSPTEAPALAPAPGPSPTLAPLASPGYGLYYHGSDQLIPTTTTNAANFPNKTPSEEYTNESYQYKKFNMDYPKNNNNGYMQQGMTSTRMLDRAYARPRTAASTTTANNNNNYYNGYASEQQGMSDTRFLEKGRYYHNVNNENNYGNRYGNSRGVEPRNEYNNRVYYGNTEKLRGVESRTRYSNGVSYENNENPYEFSKSMEGYQNQEEEEFQDDFEP